MSASGPLRGRIKNRAERDGIAELPTSIDPRLSFRENQRPLTYTPPRSSG